MWVGLDWAEDKDKTQYSYNWVSVSFGGSPELQWHFSVIPNWNIMSRSFYPYSCQLLVSRFLLTEPYLRLGPFFRAWTFPMRHPPVRCQQSIFPSSGRRMPWPSTGIWVESHSIHYTAASLYFSSSSQSITSQSKEFPGMRFKLCGDMCAQRLHFFLIRWGRRALTKTQPFLLRIQNPLTYLWAFVELQKWSNVSWKGWCGSCNHGYRFLLSLAVVVRDNLISSREPKHDTLHGLLVTGKGIVEIQTQGQVGEQVGVFVDLLYG